eukprot:scaffold35577_cov69-Cyclotella_meneghiniana.AAC.4
MKTITSSLALAASTLLSSTSAFSTVAPIKTSIYEGLSSTPLIRASDSSAILLPSQWRSQTPFGLADETAVVAFLRHYG